MPDGQEANTYSTVLLNNIISNNYGERININTGYVYGMKNNTAANRTVKSMAEMKSRWAVLSKHQYGKHARK